MNGATRALLVGPPGAGKGTQATRLGDRLGVPHVASGNLLREAIAQGTELGMQARKYMNRGDLVPDEIVTRAVTARLALPDCEGFVLDGYPRTAPQASALDEFLAAVGRPLDIVVRMDVPEEEIVSRLTGRRTCPACHRSYHMRYDPPRSNEVCDDDGTSLDTRPDDTPQTVRYRLDVYTRAADALTAHYESAGMLVRVSGLGEMDEVEERILQTVKAGPLRSPSG